MHKKQYEALAQAIKENTMIENNEYSGGEDYPVISYGFINALCDILAADNKNFDAKRFQEACK